jgi:predicted transcriptional regulator
MVTKTVSFRTPSQKIEAIDELASMQHRDRTYLLNEALDQYLELNQYHLQQIREGLREAKAGKLVAHAEVKRKLARWRTTR